MNVIGHRGASAAQPENTPEAFAAADAMGADGVELDVRIALDGGGGGGHRLVIFHDPLPDGQAAVDALVGFDEVLDACGDRMLVNVEIKNHPDDGGFDPTMAVVAPTIDAMRRRGPSWADRWLISSFSIETIDRCREIAPEIPTAFLVTDVDQDVVRSAVNGGHRAIHPSASEISEADVAECHAAGLHVNVWTCNDPDRIEELAAIGVDGVCTDVPDIALEALGRTADLPDDAPTWWRRQSV